MKYPKGIASFGDFASILVEGNLNCKEVYLTSLPTSNSERKSQNVSLHGTYVYDTFIVLQMGR